MKIRPHGAELFPQTDGRTEEANSRFSQFCEQAQKCTVRRTQYNLERHAILTAVN